MAYYLKYTNPTFVTLQMILFILVGKTYIETAIEKLAYDVKNVLTLFRINSMKANREKSQLMILRNTRCPEYSVLIDSNVIKESADVVMLGLTVDNKLSFEKHKLCQTTSHNPMRSGE